MRSQNVLNLLSSAWLGGELVPTAEEYRIRELMRISRLRLRSTSRFCRAHRNPALRSQDSCTGPNRRLQPLGLAQSSVRPLFTLQG
jgi:hypothetical protein